MDISSKESTYDFMAVLLPGSLGIFLLYITILQDYLDGGIYEKWGFFKYIILFITSYLAGLVVKFIGEKLLNCVLRNKDSDIRDALAKCDVGDGFNDLKDKANRMTAEEFRQEYYTYYYIALKGRPCSPIPFLEAKVAFLRGSCIVMPCFPLTTHYWQDYLPENFRASLDWIVILILVLILVGCPLFGAIWTQKKIYTLVWEDAYYSMQAERTMKNKANGNNNSNEIMEASSFEKYKDTYTFKSRVRRLVWNVCAFIFLRPFSLPCFRCWRLLVLRCWDAKIGKGCDVHASAVIWAPWNLEIGQGTCIGSKAIIYNPGNVVLGNKVTISQYAYLCTATHDYESRLHTLCAKTIKVDDYAWVAARAFVGPGVHIREYAVVGATASVYKDVAPGTVVGGNPAKLIKKE